MAQEALDKANSEMAARGLVVTVTQTYYAVVISQRKYATAQRASAEANHFMDISQKLVHGGEVAHSDSIKAQIQAPQQQRALPDAQLEMERSRLNLAVPAFSHFTEQFRTCACLHRLIPPP